MDFFGISDHLWLLCLAIIGVIIVVLSLLLRKQETRDCNGIPHFNQTEHEVIIVGFGILGASLATALARDGRKVVVIERDLKEPDRIVGEFLQPGGCKALELLNMRDCLEGFDAQEMLGYVMHNMCVGDKVDLSFPEELLKNQTGYAFHHGRFVMALRKAALAEPNVSVIEGTATKLVEENGVVIGVSYKTKDDDDVQVLHAPLTVVADGCFSRLRKGLVKASPETKSHFIGLLMKDCPQIKAGHAELLITDASPIVVYRLSSVYTRMLVDVRTGLPKDLRTYLQEEIYQKLPEHMKQPFLEAVTTGQLRSMPNNYLPPAPAYKKGAICLGDAFNIRHPLTGGGMSVALHDVVIYRELLRSIPRLDDYDAMHKASRELYLRRRGNHSFAVNAMSMGLYELFAANTDLVNCLKHSSFRYFQRGGDCIDQPIALLSITKPHPLLLVNHFFSVALYAAYLSLREKPVWKFPESVYKAACILLKATEIGFSITWSELKSNVT